jgi:hypothetical protein
VSELNGYIGCISAASILGGGEHGGPVAARLEGDGCCAIVAVVCAYRAVVESGIEEAVAPA